MKKSLLLASVLIIGTIQLYAQCSQFYDGFETGTFASPWAMGTGTYTTTIPSAAPAVGTYNLQLASTTSNSFYQGANAVFTSGQPTYCSWWMKTNTTTAANGYVVIGNSNIATDNGVIFCYFNATSGLRFFASTGYNHPITANTWYFVEARNMNWTARTMDIYINNALILTAWPFRSGTATNIDRIHCFSLSAATAQYDEFLIGSTPVTATSATTNVSCFAGSDGSASVTASGGSGSYTYSWAPSGGTAATATGLAAGTYTCTITDGSGCTGTATVNVTEPSAVIATTSQTNVTCNGLSNGSATVNASGGVGGYTYLWSSGGVAATETGLAAGTYTCNILDANGCAGGATVTITEPLLLMTTAASGGSVCTGDTAMLVGTATGGTMPYTYTWMPGSMNGSVVSVTPVSTTTYTMFVSDANGCNDSATVTQIVNQLPVVNLGADDTVCAGVQLDAQNPGSSYAWSTGDTTQTLMVSSGGAYNVMVTDSNGCMNSDSVNISVDAMPGAGTITNTAGADMCVGDSSMLVSSGASGIINWWVFPAAGPFWQYVGSGNPYTSNPPAQQDVGLYYFMAIASNGVCPDDTSAQITVEIHDNPVVMLGADTSACSSLLLDAQNAGSSYLWSTNDTTQTLSVNSSGTYMVWVTSQFGCMGGDTIEVTINAPPAVTGTGSANPVCMDDANVTLTGLPAGGTWTGPGVSGNMFDPSIGTGPQVLTYTYTDTNGCTGVFPFTVLVNACVGIEEVSGFNMTVYPNPNDGAFAIQFAQASENVIIEITDANGRVISAQQLNAVSEGYVHEISMNDPAVGVYFVRVISDDHVAIMKMIIE